MLLSNFLGADPAPFAPLPLYDQLTPPAYGLLLKVSSVLSIETWLIFLRAAGAAAGLATAFLIWRVARRRLSGLGVGCALAFGALTPLALRFFTETKHYAFDMAAAALMLWLSVRLVENCRAGRALGWFAAGLATVLTSFMAPIILAACGAGVAAARFGQARRTEMTAAQMLKAQRPVTAAIGSALSLSALFYVFVARDMARYQLAAYPKVYRDNLLTLDHGFSHAASVASRLPRFLVEGLSPFGHGLRDASLPAYVLVSVVLLVLLGVGFWRSCRDWPAIGVTWGAALLAVLGLSAVGKLPINTDQHFLFLTPWTALVAASGVDWLATSARRAPWRPAGVLVTGLGLIGLLVFGFTALWRAPRFDRVTMRPAVRTILAEAPTTPVWVYAQAGPVMALAHPEGLSPLPGLSGRSSVKGWLDPVVEASTGAMRPDYLTRFRQQMTGRTDVWLLFSNILNPQGATPFLTIARTQVGPCRLRRSGIDVSLYRCQAPAPASPPLAAG